MRKQAYGAQPGSGLINFGDEQERAQQQREQRARKSPWGVQY